MLASNSQKWAHQNFLGEVTVLGILPWVLMWCSTHNPSQPSLAIEMFAKVVTQWLALAFLAEQCPPAHTATSFVFSSFSFCVLECVCVDMCTPPRCGASLRRQKRVLHLEMELLAMVSCLVGEPDLNPVQEQKCSSPLSVSPGPVPCLPITKMSISPAEPASVETERQREISGFQTFFAV